MNSPEQGCAYLESIDWSASDQGVVVETTSGRFESDKLVITAGCWASSLLAELNIPLQILRKHLHWFSTKDDRYSESNGCPCFFYGLSDVFIYGFPESASSGLKIALHSGGTTISDLLADDRSEEPAVTEQIKRFLAQNLPAVSMQQLRHEVCFYTMTRDANFIIDRHPHHPRVALAAGFSGHGFKFAPAIGRVLTELVFDQTCSVDIDFLSLNRPALKNTQGVNHV